MTTYVEKGAKISNCGKYRYRLWREWRGSAPNKNWRWLGAKDGNGKELGFPKPCVFIMLNPSTADGEKDDPTIRRCVFFAKQLGFDRLEVINLFAYRATDPQQLLALNHDDDPVGVKNEEAFREATRDAGEIIAAWGVHGTHLAQDETALGWLDGFDRTVVVKCLGITKDGHPKHPLYLPSNTKPMPFRTLS